MLRGLTTVLTILMVMHDAMDAMDVEIEFDIEVKLAQVARGAHVSAARHVLDTSAVAVVVRARSRKPCTEEKSLI